MSVFFEVFFEVDWALRWLGTCEWCCESGAEDFVVVKGASWERAV